MQQKKVKGKIPTQSIFQLGDEGEKREEHIFWFIELRSDQEIAMPKARRKLRLRK